MPLGAEDENGIWQYGADDPRAPFQNTLNKLASSVSVAVGLLKSRLSSLENLAAITVAGSPFVVASGWSITAQTGRKRSGIASVSLTIQRTGAAITVPADGNIVNQKIATLAAGWAAGQGPAYVLSTSHTGLMVAGYIDGGTGEVFLSAASAGVGMPTGFTVAMTGMYLLG